LGNVSAVGITVARVYLRKSNSTTKKGNRKTKIAGIGKCCGRWYHCSSRAFEKEQ